MNVTQLERVVHALNTSLALVRAERDKLRAENAELRTESIVLGTELNAVLDSARHSACVAGHEIVELSIQLARCTC